MKIGVIKERAHHESRVSLIPAHVPILLKEGYQVYVEKNAGLKAGYSDEAYREKKALVVESQEALLKEVDIIFAVKTGAASQDLKLIENLKENHILIGLMEPYQEHEAFVKLKEKNVNAFSMELIPRTTRAQSMDVLSSTANLAGYSAAVIGANYATKMFPMMMTAAGTIPPAQVFVLGVGVAGLQAIATAKRLGALVSAYDVRSEVAEQVASLGAKFVTFDLEEAKGEGGYAKAMDEAYYEKQRALMTSELSTKDVVITTANIPGKKAPILITEAMVKAMPKGSVIVDLAAERGGNCALTEAGKVVQKHGVTIVGPLNLATDRAHNASMLYSKNMISFLQNLWVKKEKGVINWEDDIVKATYLSRYNEGFKQERANLVGGIK